MWVHLPISVSSQDAEDSTWVQKWLAEFKPSDIANSPDTRKASSVAESQTVDLMTLPFGMTSIHSMENLGEGLTSSLEDSLVRTSQLPVKEKELKKGRSRAFSMNLCAYAAKYDRASSCWRTSQGSLFTQKHIEYSENWPAWGTMLDGKLYPHPMLGQIMNEKESGLLPTPREGSMERYSTRAKRKGHLIAITYLESLLDYENGQNGFWPNPVFVELLMGWSSNWTDLNAAETESFLNNRSQLGKKSKGSRA